VYKLWPAPLKVIKGQLHFNF